jgi:Rod binding domain-containing protein
MPDIPLTLPANRATEPAFTQTAVPARHVVTADPNAGSPTTRAETFTQFEAFLLQHTLESVLPKDTTTVYGQGLAGQMWRSMLAEKFAAEIARSGGLGIASAIAEAQPAGASRLAAPGPAAPPTALTTPFAAAPTDPGRSTHVAAENAPVGAASPEGPETRALEP